MRKRQTMKKENSLGTEPTIGIIVPVYNVVQYLEECLESIVGQKHPFAEVILVNDGSTDNSGEICRKYCEKYHYFSMISQKNAGPSIARNAGLQVARSDYVVFVDSDDIISNDMSLKLKMTLCDRIFDCVFYNADILHDDRHGESQGYFKRNRQFYGKEMRGTTYLFRAFPGDYIVSPCMAVYNRRFLLNNKVFFPEGVYFEDHVFCLRTLLLAEKVMCIGESLYIRRCRKGSIMGDINSYKKCMDMIAVNRVVWDVIKESDTDSLFQIHFVSYYLINAWRVIWKSDYYAAVKEMWTDLITVFHDIWMSKYMAETMGLGDQLALYLFLHEWKGQTALCIEEVKEQVENGMIQKLNKVSFLDSDQKIGIYGIGKHTDKLLELYRKYIGRIGKGIFFITSDSAQIVQMYDGYPIVTCNEIPNDTDHIVISSLIYQNEMYEALTRAGIAEGKIVKLYEENAFCDLAVAAEILAV